MDVDAEVHLSREGARARARVSVVRVRVRVRARVSARARARVRVRERGEGGGEGHLARQLLSDVKVIAGNHLDVHMRTLDLCDGLGRVDARWVHDLQRARVLHRPVVDGDTDANRLVATLAELGVGRVDGLGLGLRGRVRVRVRVRVGRVDGPGDVVEVG